ncbi:MAG: hypothetical protein CMK74_01940 [Pseudomonadales bacterium]|nr:hypothetical protein [Pseudomonadales bacterium]
MHIIKNAIVYSADLPDAKQLGEAMEPLRFKEISECQANSYGFVETDVSPNLVAEFPGGYSFALRMDEKILPTGPVKAAQKAAIDSATADAGHDLDKGRIAEIKEAVFARLVTTALVSTTMVRAFYWPAEKYLIVATSAERNARTMMNLLINACESVKTTTIHVDGVRYGLTAHLKNHLNEMPKDFGKFNIGDSVTMKGEAEKIVFDVLSLDYARDGLLEAIRAGMDVEKLELEHGSMSFVLNGKFRFSKVHFFGSEAAEDAQAEEEFADIWARTAHIEVSQFAAALSELCVVFGRQMDIEIDTPPADTEAAEPESDQADDLYPEAVAYVRQSGRASISALQRHLKIGYNRSARMIERMEKDGVVSHMAPDGTRTVL